MAGVVHGGASRIVDLVDWKEGEAKVGFFRVVGVWLVLGGLAGWCVLSGLGLENEIGRAHV